MNKKIMSDESFSGSEFHKSLYGESLTSIDLSDVVISESGEMQPRWGHDPKLISEVQCMPPLVVGIGICLFLIPALLLAIGYCQGVI